MFDFGLYNSNAMTCTSSPRSTAFSTQDFHDALDLMDKLKARRDVSKSSTYFAILSMSKCCKCGYKTEYREGPPETVVLCDHQIAELKKMSKPDPVAGPGSPFTGPSIGGFAIERYEPQRAEAGASK